MYPNVPFKLSTVVSDHGTTDSRNNVPSNFKGALTAGFVVELSHKTQRIYFDGARLRRDGNWRWYSPLCRLHTEAGATIDFITAANKILAQLNIKRYDEYFLAGYSQGAHAAMSTLKD